MLQTNGWSRRIASSLRSRISRSAAESPDGPIAMYAWLWQSTGQRPGRTMMPRPVRFAFIATSDLVSAGGWYVRARAFRTSRSVLRWTGVAALAVVLGISPALQVSGQDQDVEAVIESYGITAVNSIAVGSPVKEWSWRWDQTQAARSSMTTRSTSPYTENSWLYSRLC